MLTNFYYAAMIFCYEYGLTEFAEYLYNDVTARPEILGFNNAKTKIKKNQEFQMFCRCYEILFYTKEDKEITISLLQILVEYCNEKNPAVLKPVIHVFLRHNLITIQKALFWCLRDQQYLTTYTDLVKVTHQYLNNFIKQILPPNDIKIYYTEEASLDCYTCILLILCAQPKHHLDISNPNIYYKIHRFIYENIQYRYDHLKILVMSQRIAEYHLLGDLPEITQELIHILSIL